MRYYPVNLDIKNRHCLVVGGGAVATRKVKTLLKCGALVTVVSPNISDTLRSLAQEGGIVVENREYRNSDMGNHFLVIGATDDTDLNQRIFTEAEAKGRLCNIADQPDACNFILPAIVHQGDLVLAISTSGKSPAFAKHLRKELEKRFGFEYAAFLQLMGAIRETLLSREHNPEAHKDKFEALIQKGLIGLIKDRQIEAIDALLKEVLGPGFEYRALMNQKTR